MRLLNALNVLFLLGYAVTSVAWQKGEQKMNEKWGEHVVRLDAQSAGRRWLLCNGNFAMFIRRGLYSNIGNDSNSDLLKYFHQ